MITENGFSMKEHIKELQEKRKHLIYLLEEVELSDRIRKITEGQLDWIDRRLEDYKKSEE